jgi:hypothetical protein
MTARCKAGARTIPTRRPTPRPLPGTPTTATRPRSATLAWRNAYDPGPLNGMTDAAVEEQRRRQAQGDVRRCRSHRETSPFIVMFQIGYQTGLRANRPASTPAAPPTRPPTGPWRSKRQGAPGAGARPPFRMTDLLRPLPPDRPLRSTAGVADCRWPSPFSGCCSSPSSSPAWCRSTRCCRSWATARPRRRSRPSASAGPGPAAVGAVRHLCLAGAAGRSGHLDPHQTAGDRGDRPLFSPPRWSWPPWARSSAWRSACPRACWPPPEARQLGRPDRAAGRADGLFDAGVLAGADGAAAVLRRLDWVGGPGRLDPPMT